MTSIKRVLRLAAPAALALAVAAPSALATSVFSEVKCDFPSSAASDLDFGINFSSVGNTFTYEEKDCEKLCKDLTKLCESNAKIREKCIKTDDKAFFSILKDQCKINFPDDNEARKVCEDDVKQDEDECKDDLKDEKGFGKENCRNAFGKDSTCVDDCLDPTSFPFFD